MAMGLIDADADSIKTAKPMLTMVMLATMSMVTLMLMKLTTTLVIAMTLMTVMTKSHII